MAFLKTEAVVIKTFNLRETDKIITFFSADFGKIQGIAKGIRKIKSRYSGKLELFTRVRVIFFRKTAVGGFSGTHPLLRITQVDAIEAFPQLHADFNKIIGASYVAEFLNKVFEEYDNTHQAVYTLVCDTLRVLAASDQLRNILPAVRLYGSLLHIVTSLPQITNSARQSEALEPIECFKSRERSPILQVS
jgi:DNA repair protein RecO (recombination protein O)